MRTKRHHLHPPALARACVAAGPAFVTAMLLLLYVDRVAEAEFAMPPDLLPALGGAAVLMIPVIGVGMALAVVPVCVGAALLRSLADRIEEAAAPGLWMAVGAMVAGGVGWALAPDFPELAVALAATGAVCAALSRRGLRRG